MECCPTPLQWLCEVAGYSWELEHTVVHIDPEHAKHAQWVTCLVSIQLSGLGTERCDMGPCIIMLKHEVMGVDGLHNNGPQDLVMVSL